MLQVTNIYTQEIILEAEALISDLKVYNQYFGYDSWSSIGNNGDEIIAQMVKGFVTVAMFIGNEYIAPVAIDTLEAILVQAQPVYQNTFK